MVYRDRSIWIMPYLCKACYFILLMKGMSANADPHYQKLYGRVTDVCSNRRGQPNLCAMIEPHPGRNPYLIRFAPPSGKYALYGKKFREVFKRFSRTCGLEGNRTVIQNHKAQVEQYLRQKIVSFRLISPIFFLAARRINKESINDQ